MNYNEPLPGHCEGCDEQRLDIRLYYVQYTDPPPGHRRPQVYYEAYYCPDCAQLAKANWSGTIESICLPSELPSPEASDAPDPDIRLGGKHHGDPWCDPAAR